MDQAAPFEVVEPIPAVRESLGRLRSRDDPA